MAEVQLRVIVCGDSLILAGVQVSLGAHPRLEVIHVDASGVGLEQRLLDLQPAAVLFDLGGTLPALPGSLLLSDLLLIGIDPESSKALVWSGRQETTVATADLVNLICALTGSGQDSSLQSQPNAVS